MGVRRKLFCHKKIYDITGTDEQFVRAMRLNCEFHYQNCSEYAAILDSCGFSPADLLSAEDLGRLPPLPTIYFKRHSIRSMQLRHAIFRTTSSGTTGQKSEVQFDLGGFLCDAAMALRTSMHHHLFSLRPVNYLILGYQPHRSNQMGVMKSAFLSTFLAPALHREYALKYRDGAYHLDLEGIIHTLQRYEKQGHPVRLIGFPSYLHFLAEEMEQRGIRLNLTSGSKILLGGGWKQFYKQKVEKTQLYEEIRRQFSIPESEIHEVFSVVEHPIIYWDCPNHHFHVPIYSRVIIRDVETLKPLPMGKLGLVNLMTPMLKSAPLLSIMTDDLGILHEGAHCGCGCEAPWLEVVGRIGMADIKTCAAGAEERRREAGI